MIDTNCLSLPITKESFFFHLTDIVMMLKSTCQLATQQFAIVYRFLLQGRLLWLSIDGAHQMH